MTEESGHAHTWRDCGRCKHPHSSGSNDYALFVCDACGRFGHRGPITFACGRRTRGPIPPADCPVGVDHSADAVELLVDRHQAEEYVRHVAAEAAQREYDLRRQARGAQA